MHKYKRVLRRIGLWCIIVLAVVGMSLAGGVPIPIIFRRKDKSEHVIEMEDEDDDVLVL